MKPKNKVYWKWFFKTIKCPGYPGIGRYKHNASGLCLVVENTLDTRIYCKECAKSMSKRGMHKIWRWFL